MRCIPAAGFLVALLVGFTGLGCGSKAADVGSSGANDSSKAIEEALAPGGGPQEENPAEEGQKKAEIKDLRRVANYTLPAAGGESLILTFRYGTTGELENVDLKPPMPAIDVSERQITHILHTKEGKDITVLATWTVGDNPDMTNLVVTPAAPDGADKADETKAEYHVASLEGPEIGVVGMWKAGKLTNVSLEETVPQPTQAAASTPVSAPLPAAPQP